MNKNIKKILSNAYFIGGSPCSGKSTLSNLLAERYNFVYYKIDDYEQEHINKSDSKKHPIMHKWKEPIWDEIWMRPVDIQVKEEFKFYIERFEMILSDLKQFSEEDIIIMEGAALLPELIKKIDVDVNRIIYMIPSKKFQIEYYSKRDFIKGILFECSKPEKAFINWMERDHRFGEKVKEQAEKLGYKVIYVDGEKTIEDNFDLVSKHFGLV